MTEYIVQVRKIDPILGQPAGIVLTYAYRSPLWPGDKVMCPPNEWAGPFIAEVVALGAGDYSGSLRQLLCRVAPDRKRAPAAAASP